MASLYLYKHFFLIIHFPFKAAQMGHKSDLNNSKDEKRQRQYPAAGLDSHLDVGKWF